MEEGFDLDNMIDSMNLSGQWQPSTLPLVSDPSLDSQILGDFDTCDIFSRLNSSSPDEIHHALVDTPPALFNSSSPSESALTAESMTDLLSTFHFELPVQSNIEDSMERMNICQTHTSSAMTASADSFDLLTSSASAIPMGSSPVEQKEIDNSILARHCVRNQQRLLKSAPKPRRHSGIRPTFSSVAPIDIVTTYNGSQPYATAQNSTEFDEQQKLLQCDAAEWKKISIRCQPRQRFRPRRRTESQDIKHYIRCEPGNEFDYPTIDLPQSWARQSVTNIIEVTLVTKSKLPHFYSLENKQCQPFFDGSALIFRESESNTLYYRLTPEDFSKGYKSFMAEHIKEKQGAVITKDLIQTHELEQSMLRFTRIFEEKSTFLRDESSTAFSCVMTEVYGDVAIDHMGPRYGPMAGNERVYAVVKGRANKEDLTVYVHEVLTGWREQIAFTKTGNVLFFAMPRYPSLQRARAVVTITICYQGAELHESNFVYKDALDEELASLNLGESAMVAGPSSSRSFDVLDLISATGVRPVAPPGTKRAKRLSAGPRKV